MRIGKRTIEPSPPLGPPQERLSVLGTGHLKRDHPLSHSGMYPLQRANATPLQKFPRGVAGDVGSAGDVPLAQAGVHDAGDGAGAVAGRRRINMTGAP